MFGIDFFILFSDAMENFITFRKFFLETLLPIFKKCIHRKTAHTLFLGRLIGFSELSSNSTPSVCFYEKFSAPQMFKKTGQKRHL